MRLKVLIPLVLAGATALAVWVFMPGGYSETHPYLLHNCARMASLCPSHQATWAPPYGGTALSQHYLYGLCACSASVHAVVG